MKQLRIPATFIRGGTSKALVFHTRDLPEDPGQRDLFLVAATGSPDAFGRQLDGMGGGVSSLSKICFVGHPSHPEADVDYTKGQVQIKEARVDYASNCGNMSSAIGPFAVDEGLVKVASNGEALVRIFNTNTRKLIHARFEVSDGYARVDGDLAIPGVYGTGAPVRLDFLDPGGATTGHLLPTGNVVDLLKVPGVGEIPVSMVDAANACVFVRASDLGLKGTEMPEQIDAIPGLLQRLSAIRCAASLAMGITADPEAAARKSVPIIGFVSAAQEAPVLTGGTTAAGDIDLTARMLSNGQPHRALPLTASLCLSVAARIAGTLVNQCIAQHADSDGTLRIGMPSGVLVTDAKVSRDDTGWNAATCTLLRTQRRLFDGHVYANSTRL